MAAPKLRSYEVREVMNGYVVFERPAWDRPGSEVGTYLAKDLDEVRDVLQILHDAPDDLVA